MSERRVNQPVAILVVEDEALVRLMVADTLEEAGFDVIEACNAADALPLLEARPDIRALVTDVEMPPGISGYELARLVRANHPHVAIVIVSGRLEPRASDLPAGGHFFLKPVPPGTLVERIKTLIKSEDGSDLLS